VPGRSDEFGLVLRGSLSNIRTAKELWTHGAARAARHCGRGDCGAVLRCISPKLALTGSVDHRQESPLIVVERKTFTQSELHRV
jgi:hypothetical protein